MARGPGYPYINLEDAVSLAQRLYQFAKRSPVSIETVLKDTWDYSPTSSSAVKVLAAMNYFGLIESVAGQNGNKQELIRITDRAYRILVDMPDSAERKQAIRDAFLAPKAYKLCWQTWGTEPPPSMRSTLLFSHGFIDSTVDQFITNYKKSLVFADMAQPESINLDQGDDKGGENSAGDISNKSADQLKSAPLINQVGAAGVPLRRTTGSVPANLERSAGMRQEVFTLEEGDVTISWPEAISAESFDDFNDWISILLRKVKRNSQAKPGKADESQ